MNFEEIGPIIAKIHKKDDDKKKVIINVSAAPLQLQDEISIVDEITTPKDELMQHMPYKDEKNGNNRQVLYISGASGSGKSYYVAQYLKEYLKMFPKNLIYIFSSLETDKTLDELHKTRIKRIKLNEKFLETPLQIEMFTDCLVLYDDTEMITNPALAEKLGALKALIMTTGRHTGTFYIETSHLANGFKNRLILAEAHSITLFLISMGAGTLFRFLENAFGFNTKQIRRIQNIKSRWITLFRTQPITVMHEHGAMHIHNRE